MLFYANLHTYQFLMFYFIFIGEIVAIAHFRWEVDVMARSFQYRKYSSRLCL